MTLLVRNVGTLSTGFFLRRSIPPAFSVSPLSGDLKPGEHCALRVSFCPTRQKAVQFDLNVIGVGAHAPPLRIIGRGGEGISEWFRHHRHRYVHHNHRRHHHHQRHRHRRLHHQQHNHLHHHHCRRRHHHHQLHRQHVATTITITITNAYTFLWNRCAWSSLSP